MVFLDVHARARGAFAADARPDNLGQAVIVEGAQIHLFLNLDAHVLGPHFTAEMGEFQGKGARVHVHAAGDLGNVQSITGRADKRIGLQVAHQHDLSCCVARSGGNNGGADLLDAVMQAETAGKQTVSEGDLHGMAGPQPARNQKAGAETGPHLEVGLGISHKSGHAGGAGGAMDARQLLARHGAQSQGIIITHVGLGRIRQSLQIIQAVDVVRRDVVARKKFLVKGRLHGAANGFFQPQHLKRFAFGTGQGFFLIEDSVFADKSGHSLLPLRKVANNISSPHEYGVRKRPPLFIAGSVHKVRRRQPHSHRPPVMR